MDSEITSAALQRLLGIGKLALNDLAKRGIVHRGERKGSYLVEPPVASYCQHLREQAAGRGRRFHGLRLEMAHFASWTSDDTLPVISTGHCARRRKS